MAAQVIRGNEFKSEQSLISYSEKPNILDSGAKYVWLGYKSKNLIVQTPTMDIPFGLNVYDKGEYPKYSIELSFRGSENDKNLSSFQENLQLFDEQIVDLGVKNSMSWFKKKNAKRDVIQAMFNPQVKVPTDKDTGEPLPQYPNRIRVKIPFKDDKFDCEVLDQNGKRVESDISKVLVSGTRVKAIIQCVGLWISAGNFNCQWKLVTLRIKTPGGKPKIDFLPDTDDEDAEESTPTTDNKKVSKEEEADDADEASDADTDDDAEDGSEEDESEIEEDSEDDEPEPEPPKPVKAKKGRKTKASKE